MLDIQNLFFKYKKKLVLKDITLSLNKGEILSVIGINGSGKTTLLKCIVNIIKPTRGSVLINGRDSSKISRLERAKYISYLPQNIPFKFPITVFDVILMGRMPYIKWKPSERDINATSKIIKSMNFEDIALKNFDHLSGGQKQKVLLARLFVQNTDCLILDEPTSSLDLKYQIQIMEMIKDLVKTQKKSAVIAIHDLNMAARYSNKIIMLNLGKVFCFDSPAKVLTEKNIKTVYKVQTIINNDNNFLQISPIKVID